MPGALLVSGALLLLVAAIGVLRMPDVYLRMAAVSKAATLGVTLALLGAACHFGGLAIFGRVLVTVLFLHLTAPLAAHRIGRAAYRRGEPTYPGTRDELARARQSLKL